MYVPALYVVVLTCTPGRTEHDARPSGHRPQSPYAQGRTCATHEQTRAGALVKKGNRTIGGATTSGRILARPPEDQAGRQRLTNADMDGGWRVRESRLLGFGGGGFRGACKARSRIGRISIYGGRGSCGAYHPHSGDPAFVGVEILKHCIMTPKTGRDSNMAGAHHRQHTKQERCGKSETLRHVSRGVTTQVIGSLVLVCCEPGA